MAPRKSAIFIGREGADTGLDEYRKLAKLHNIKLDEHTNTPNAAQYLKNYDYAFVSRYLAILEALKAGVPVIAHYNNAIKKDYLELSPFAGFIQTFKRAEDADLKIDKQKVALGQQWSKSQTWEKLADIYEELWQK
jgi:hypothetical protein